MNKLQLAEKLENQSFKERVYLEMINQYPDLNISLDELDEGLSNLFDKVERAKNNAKAKKIETKADANTIDRILDIKRKKNDAAINRAEKKSASKNVRLNNKLFRAEKKSASKNVRLNNKLFRAEKKATSKNVRFNNKLLSRAAGAEDIKDMQLDRELARKRKIEDDERDRKQRIKNDHKQTFDSIKNGATNAGKFANKHKKEIGVAAAGAAGLAATGVAIKTIKDRQKFKAWKNVNPKKRSKVTYDQWVDLGRPLNESIDNFIEGYFDAIYNE